MNNPVSAETKKGAINALLAYSMWGFAPIYFKLVSEVSATEILMHRVVWAVLILAVIVVAMNKTTQVVSVLRDKAMMQRLFVSATLLAINWFIFIWAVNTDHILDASLGYYINPLFSVFLGIVF